MKGVITNFKNGKRGLIEGSFIIAIVSGIAYLISFSYEAGFCNVFGLPLQFISLNLTTVLLVGFALFPLLFWIYSAIASVFIVVPKKGIVWRQLSALCCWFVLLVGAFFLYKTEWKEWIYFLIVFILFAVAKFAVPLITQRDKKTYLEKLEAQEEKDKKRWEQEKKDEFIYYLQQYFGENIINRILLILLFICIILSLSYLTGRAKAITQKQYPVITINDSEMVLLRIYNDKMFFALFDRRTREVGKSFYIIEIEDLNTMLNLEEVGPLQVS